LSESVIQYLYMRSYFPPAGIGGDAALAIGGDVALAIRHYRRLARATWMKEPVHLQGMIALALFRAGDSAAARSILASLRETAIHDEELGMYWAETEDGYYWYQAPVETSALMIEAFREIAHDTTADRELKTWLLRQKQTQHWATTKATADAVYALLGGGADWLNQERMVTVQLGAERMEMAGEARTGYDKKVFDGPRVSPSMGNITVLMSTSQGGGSPARGADRRVASLPRGAAVLPPGEQSIGSISTNWTGLRRHTAARPRHCASRSDSLFNGIPTAVRCWIPSRTRGPSMSVIAWWCG
jgi:hypothetical protein